MFPLSSNVIINKKIKREGGVALFSALIVLLMIIPFIHSGTLQITNDGAFHLQRINEIFMDLKSGRLSYIATHTFSHAGMASFEFYPSVFLYPWAALQFIFKPVIAFYVGWGIVLFVTFEIAFHCMWSFSNGNWLRSIFFATIYGLSGKFITEFAKFQLGELFAYMFLPLAFLGFYKAFVIGDRKGILPLTLGITLIAYSHFITLYMTGGLMLFLFVILIFKKRITRNKILYAIKSLSIFLLLSLWEFIPLITNSFNKSVATPVFSFWPVDVNALWNTSWCNQLYSDSSVGLTVIIILVIGWAFVASKKEKWIYILGMFLCFITTSLFPWNMISKTKLIHLFMPLQFSFRFLPLAVLMLSVTGSLICTRLVQLCIKEIKPLVILLLLVFVAGNYVTLIHPLFSAINSKEIQLLATKPRNLAPTIFVRNKQYNWINEGIAPNGSIDYMPKVTVGSQKRINSVQLGDVYINGSRINKEKVVAGPNTLVYKIYARKGDRINLPAVEYKRTFVKLNGKSITAYRSARGTVQINAMNTGYQRVLVTYKPTLFYRFLMVVALFTWLVLFMKFIVIRLIRMTV